ncbi:MAG: hypothetical protein H6739_16505 [Alphaproteobacteria bacterium]|nr:hypothetical protein [Alphaproteobacteria bacterium]
MIKRLGVALGVGVLVGLGAAVVPSLRRAAPAEVRLPEVPLDGAQVAIAPPPEGCLASHHVRLPLERCTDSSVVGTVSGEWAEQGLALWFDRPAVSRAEAGNPPPHSGCRLRCRYGDAPAAELVLDLAEPDFTGTARCASARGWVVDFVVQDAAPPSGSLATKLWSAQDERPRACRSDAPPQTFPRPESSPVL